MRPLRRQFAAVMLALVALAAAPAGAGAAADIGFSGPSFSGASAPTGQKPQSKLWYHDGFWWGVLFNAATTDFEIYRLDGGGWRPTGTLVDGRTGASADVLWNGSRLYVASAGPNATDANHAVRVSRLRYDAGTRTWAQDVAPVSLTGGGVEAVVLDRDKTARVWVTYTSGGRVFVAHTTTGDGTWAPPYVLPVKGAGTLTSDDISTLVAYDGRIGVLWSNQNEESVYFASHRDGDGTAVWSVQTALSGPKYADDHLNIKSLEADSSGRVFAAVKTSVNDLGGTASSAPLTLLLVLGGAGSWQRHTFGTVGDDHTRPLVLLQPDARRLHMLAASPCCSGGAIYLKSTSLDKIAFAPGLGTPFLRSDTDANINNIASTKQTLTNATGLVAIAGDDRTKRYWTSVLALGADTTPPQTAIDSGPSGTTSSTSASFSFSASETGSKFACSTDGGAAAPCTSPATLSGLAAGTHTFSVRATDGAGNTDPTPAQRTWTVDPAAALFADGFESGDLRSWTTVATGGQGVATVGSVPVRSGAFAARLSSTSATGSYAYARRSLAERPQTLTVALDVRVEAQGASGANVPLLRLFDASGARIVSVYRQNEAGDKVYIGHSATSALTAARLALGTWKRIEVSVVTAGTGASTIVVRADGQEVYRTATASLGTSGVGALQIGNDTKSQSYTLVADDIRADAR